MQGHGSAPTEDTQMIMITVSRWRGPQCSKRAAKAGVSVSLVGARWSRAGVGGRARLGGRRVLSTRLRRLTGSCFLCAPQVLPGSTSPSFFISVPSFPRGYFSYYFGYLRAHVTTHAAEGRVHSRCSKSIWPGASLCQVTLGK